MMARLRALFGSAPAARPEGGWQGKRCDGCDEHAGRLQRHENGLLYCSRCSEEVEASGIKPV